MESPHLSPVLWPAPAERDDFNDPELGFKWNFLGIPRPEDWSLARRPGSLWLKGNASRLDDGLGVVFVGCRQEHFNCEVATSLFFSPRIDGEEAGLTVWMDQRHHYDLFVSHVDGKNFINVRRRIGSLSATVALEEFSNDQVTLIVRANRLFYSFAVKTDRSEHILATGETRYLSSEVAGGFTGVYFALYASGNDQASSTPACFDWFDYRSLEQPGFLTLDSTLSDLLKDDIAKEIIGRTLPDLIANPPAEWGANLSLLDLAAMSPDDISPDTLIIIDEALRRAQIVCQPI